MDLMQYLKRPSLVSNIQRYFGIRLIDKTGPKDSSINGYSKQSDYISKKEYEITNKFWYYLFLYSTNLGDETFYAYFIPFWFWNIDGAVGRRVVLVWSTVMYIGQGVKDIIRWERPGPPVVKLQSKWALEYGMPSTHAMAGASIPFSVVMYTMDRYQYSTSVGLMIAFCWCSLICVSRLYLGMHTILDIIAGLLLSILIMIPLVPLVNKVDTFFLTNPTSPFLVLVTSILMIVYYPNSGKWTPTRGDTTMIVSVVVGLLVGFWLNYQTGTMTASELSPPYMIIWPSPLMLSFLLLRTFIGFLSILLTRIISKYIAYNFFCTLLGQNVESVKNSENSLQNKHKNFVELSTKYFSCVMVGFITVCAAPQLFRILRIERPTLYTEL